MNDMTSTDTALAIPAPAQLAVLLREPAQVDALMAGSIPNVRVEF